MRVFLGTLGLLIGLLWGLASPASAQQIGGGLGTGFVIPTGYVDNRLDREFRVAPDSSAGYFPILEEWDNQQGSLHFNLLLVFNRAEIASWFDDLEIRFDLGIFSWSTATVTHTSCSPVELIDNQFSPENVAELPMLCNWLCN